ncbi:MAG TPA: MATE family efflux transporter, partial [Atribacterota bacterium]|nr:MATE family efflux transporter [Atribacterota bacterium]
RCRNTGIAVTLISLIFISPILHLIGVTPETHGYAHGYLAIIFAGSIIIMLNFLLTLMLRSEGAVKVAMYGMFIGTGINIVLDPIFIQVLGYGVKGAAIATLIGQGVGLLYYFDFYRKKKSMVSLHWEYISLRSDIILEILKVGIPASSYNIMLSIANTIGNYVAAGYNDLILAAYGINRRIFSMAMMTLTGLAEGSQPIIGYSYGARKIDRMNKVIKTSISLAAGISFFFVGFFYLFAGKMIQIFINNEEVISYGIQIMRAMIISLPLMAIQFLIRVTFQALGKGKPAFMLALARDIFYIPALFALNKYFGFSGFVYAQPFAHVFTFLLAIVLYNTIRGKITEEHREWEIKNNLASTEVATSTIGKSN